MYVIFKCRKCGHLLRRDGHTMDSFMDFFEDLCKGKNCPNCGGIMYWDDEWECTDCGEIIDSDEDDNDGIIEG